MPDEPLPPHDRFEQAYASRPPWETGLPQPVFVRAADQITGSVLDAGCGTGENALLLAARGLTVTAFDFLKAPIRRAKEKAAQRKLGVRFLVMDAMDLGDFPETFDSVIDSGMFHVFPDNARTRYVDGLSCVVKPGGRLFLCCFSEREPGTHGPRRVTEAEIRNAFAVGWEVESITEARYDVRADCAALTFSAGGPFAWFSVIRKTP